MTKGSDRPQPIFNPSPPLASRAVLLRAETSALDAAALVAQHAALLAQGNRAPLPPLTSTAIEGDAQLRRAEAGLIVRDAKARLDAAATRFRTELSWIEGEPNASLQSAETRFEETLASARGIIGDYEGYAAHTIERGRLSALAYLATPLDAFVLPQLAPRWYDIWQHEQTHQLCGRQVKLTKRKIETEIHVGPEDEVGRTIRSGEITFHPPDGSRQPPTKYLAREQVVRVGERELTALDPSDVELGNLIGDFPNPDGTRTPANFWGYIKVLEVSRATAGCRIEFQQVAIGRRLIRPNDPGLKGRWLNVTRGPGDAPVPPNTPVKDGQFAYGAGARWLFADFPSSWMEDDWPASSYSVVDELFRTWVVELCPNAAPNVLGYWEWSFSLVTHKTAAGIESVNTPPGPPGVAPPPGGWPPSPAAGPTRWVNAATAPPDATGQHRALYPESY